MPTAPYIPENAPFPVEQRAYLNGLLAGMFSSNDSAAPATASAALPITILFGSQSGNSEALAKQIGKAAKTKNLAPTVVDLADYKPESIATESHLLLITSTYGDGEPPDSAKAFHDFLLSDAAPRLESLKFSVLGLGDSNYPDFNQCAKEFDARFAELGATRLADAVHCDVDFEDAAESWRVAAFAALENESGDGLAATTQPSAVNAQESTIPNPSSPSLTYDKKHPYPARVLRNLNLNQDGSAKETRHIEINLGQSGLVYEAGDALGIVPTNGRALVDAIIDATGLHEDAPTPLPDGSIAPLGEALRLHYDINRLAAPFVEACARLADSATLNQLVADKEAMKAYLNGRNILDPIKEANIRFPSTEQLIAPLKKLQPRVYSISSSPKAHPGEVHLTVGTVRWQAHGTERLGVCSNYIASLREDDRCRVFVQPNQSFRPPTESDTPMIMVGPGTGIAPFRAFIEERAALGHRGPNWLFFGDQKSACDFLYADELAFWQKKGVLTRLDTAFSRDQAQKVYVQDRMHENGAELYQWLEQGGHFYVCGDASRMAKDVDATLHTIIAEQSGKGADFAAQYVKSLRDSKRYVRDVY
jgi:sulfite reductase (NADPH) flavoprotein alpha-component